MASISILKDAVRDANFALIVKEQETTRFYGFHELGSEWAKEAEASFSKSGEYPMPDGISQTAFKTVSKNILDKIVSKTAESTESEKSFTETILEKVALLRPVFVERAKFAKVDKFATKTLEDKISQNSINLSKMNKFNLKARKFISDNRKSSFSVGIKNSGLAIESQSGSIISAKNDTELMGKATELQGKLGSSFTRRFIRVKNLEQSTNSENRRALRRAKSLSPIYKTNGNRIEVAKKDVHERF
jgi:hypothetical protein